MIRIGVDIGGTFTDFALVGNGQPLAVHKQLTTPSDPSQAVLEGIDALMERAGLQLADVTDIVHGTTLVTNAIIERKGARTGMLVTAGFSDLLEIGLEQRYELFDLRLRFAPPVVRRTDRAEIGERIRYDGSIETALNTKEVHDKIAALVESGIESLAICFLHAYANPTHEDTARQIAADAFPNLYVSSSADVFPYMREFERWTTTTVNAYSQPGFDRYLRQLELGLAMRGFKNRLFLMSSSGGIVSVETARRFPVRMLESGPAAGVLMAAEHGRRRGIDDLFAFDLGGTTAKGALIRGGRPLKRYEMEVARTYHHKRGSGLSLKLPVIDMTEIGAGGGSIAMVDERGLLRVGPRSAGAEPGPACYGRSGTDPTLTDANLTLGYLDASYFLGGNMRLDAGLAKTAINEGVAKRLGIDVVRAAWGIYETINEDIARAFRIHAVERGFDTRRGTIVAFGGGGPIHAAAVARKLKIPRVIFPVAAGVMSALGLLASPASFEVARSFRADIAQLDPAIFSETLAKLVAEARIFLNTAGLVDEAVVIDRRVDLRYRGQGYELEIQLPDGMPDNEIFKQLPSLFAQKYEQVFHVGFLEEPLEIITWKVEARGPAPVLPPLEFETSDTLVALKGTRLSYQDGYGFVDTPVYDRYRLRPGDRIEGPALIEERESTCLLGTEYTATIDDQFNLVAEFGS